MNDQAKPHVSLEAIAWDLTQHWRRLRDLRDLLHHGGHEEVALELTKICRRLNTVTERLEIKLNNRWQDPPP